MAEKMNLNCFSCHLNRVHLNLLCFVISLGAFENDIH